MELSLLVPLWVCDCLFEECYLCLPEYLGQMASPPPLDKEWRMRSWIQSHLVVQILFSYKKYSLSLHCDE